MVAITKKSNFSDEDIRDKAYQLWLRAGCPEGHDKYYWEWAEFLIGCPPYFYETEVKNET